MINFILLLAGVLLLVPSATVSLQAICSLFSKRPFTYAGYPRADAAIIVPAHNEGTHVEPTLTAILRQVTVGDRVIVVAHNCVDDTADIARLLGAEVIVHNNMSERGKAYALDAGVKFLHQTGNRIVVVFIDADSILAEGALDILVQACGAEDAPIQARYIMEDDGLSDVRQRVGAFAWRFKGEVRASGYRALGLPCPLMGTGMALPSHLLERVDLSTSHITEDLVLGIQCALLGYAPHYCPDAVVSSEFAPSRSGREAQKRRWVHGHLSAMREFVPILVKNAFSRRDITLGALAADLMVPPLGLLGVGVVSLNFVSLLWLLITGHAWPSILALASLIMCCLALSIAWARSGRDLIGWKEVKGLPSYVARQVATGLQLLVGRRSGWIRSERK